MMDTRERFLAEVIVDAGAHALAWYRRADLVIERKGLQDLVTEADREVEEFLIDRIRTAFPHDGFVGEEGGVQPGRDAASPVWVIDPIDGTTNFTRRLPLWCVSVGIRQGDHTEVAAILNPVTAELWRARRGRGATLNGRPLRVSAETEPQRARAALGFSFRRPPAQHTAAVASLLDRGCAYANLGSGALGLAMVADGRFEAFWEAHINAWDVAAGLLLVTEAGGWATDFWADNGLANGNPLLACTPTLKDFFTSALSAPAYRP